jgi:hypothetical protein
MPKKDFFDWKEQLSGWRQNPLRQAKTEKATRRRRRHFSISWP